MDDQEPIPIPVLEPIQEVYQSFRYTSSSNYNTFSNILKLIMNNNEDVFWHINIIARLIFYKFIILMSPCMFHQMKLAKTV